MKNRNLIFAVITIVICLACQKKDSLIQVENPKTSTLLFFAQPAKVWNEAIPIGNGRLGGMVYGDVSLERIATNDDTFWSGEPLNLQNEEASKYLPGIRELLLNEQNLEAQKIIDKHLLGPYNQCYMPLADILISLPKGKVTNYRRELDLEKGVVNVTYVQNGVEYKRKIFASYPDQAIVVKITTNKSQSISCKATLSSQVQSKLRKVDSQTIALEGKAPKHADPHYVGKRKPIYEKEHGMRFSSRLHVLRADGKVQVQGDSLCIDKASEVTFIYVAATSYNGFDKDPFKEGKDERKLTRIYEDKIKKMTYEKLLSNHIKDYQSLFGRVKIDLGTSKYDTISLDQRIKNYASESDPSLTALYFQFGRYLLISSSRPGSQPANLQGIWNKDMQPAWSANWTINCNAQLNYFPVEMVNLSECHLPLFDMIREATVDGRKTAKTLYHSRGWMAHHNLDLWRTTWPVGGTGLWSLFQVGGAWLCQHIWNHYLYTQDLDFLKTYYPILRDASLFYVDNLQKDKDGYLVTNPSESFENLYQKPNGEKGWACIGAAQDMQVIRALYKHTLATIDLLNESKEVRQEIQKSYNQLAPMKISPTTGRLQEWNDDWQPASPKNGQVGHGWAFVASDLISLRKTPKLAKAFRKTIEYRKPGYSYNSGSWTGAFPANYWARFEEGDSVQRVIDRHFKLALSPNFTCDFSGYWEIDGNLGVTAAIAQMFLQSHAGEINLLPALPKKYIKGSISGLKAEGGYTVALTWKNGSMKKVVIDSKKNGKMIVRYKEKTKTISVEKGEKVILNHLLKRIN